ncbi:MAG: hypothetical protein PVH68_06935 [Armatimonadota bacterium]|jgi:hypothetical protein
MNFYVLLQQPEGRGTPQVGLCPIGSQAEQTLLLLHGHGRLLDH